MKYARVHAAFVAALMLSTTIFVLPGWAQEAPQPQTPAAKAPAGAAAAKAAPKAGAPGAPASPAAAEAAQKQKEVEAAKRSFEAGIKSYQAGKFDPAVQSLSAALRGGGLSSQDMARGLYYRGLAYKKQAKPGLAISDLTSALWLKNGLGDADRQSATAERADAYKMAGLGDGNSGTETVAVADPNAKAPAAATGAAAPVPAAAPSPIPGSEPSQETLAPAAKTVANESGIPNPFATAEGPPQPARAAPTSTGGIDQAAALNQPGVEPTKAPAPPAAAAAVPAPIPQQGQKQPASNNTVSGFFSNLFGGGSSAPAEQAPVTTASTDQTTSASSSWTGTTQATSGTKPKAAAAPQIVAAADPAAAAAPAAVAKKAAAPAQAQPAAAPVTTPQTVAPQAAAPQVKGGKYKIHIAALRSRPEAEALAQKLSAQHGNQLAARAPTVDEAIIGSMGKFYRVRVGSYATADEPRGLCNTLRNSGYDCLVVTN